MGELKQNEEVAFTRIIIQERMGTGKKSSRKWKVGKQDETGRAGSKEPLRIGSEKEVDGAQNLQMLGFEKQLTFWVCF